MYRKNNTVCFLIFILCCLRDSFGKNGTHIFNVDPIKLMERQFNSDNQEINHEEKDFLHPNGFRLSFDLLNKLENAECVRDIKIMLESLEIREKWALQMYDSSPKFPVGVLHSNHYQFGNFDECIEVKQTENSNHENVTGVTGQYCLADINIRKIKQDDKNIYTLADYSKSRSRQDFNTTLHWALCIPSKCAPRDAEIIITEIFNSLKGQLNSSVTVTDKSCYVQKNVSLNNLEIVYGCIIGLFLVFTMMATFFHYFYLRNEKSHLKFNIHSQKSNPNVLKDVIICFSLIQTIRKWLHTKPSNLNLECISGIKIFSMALICMGHALLFALGGPVDNVSFQVNQSMKVENGAFYNNPLLVDTFLLISGFLMCYLMLIELDKRKGKLNIFILYIARYIRLTPSYLVIIGLYCTYLYRIGSGPLWNSKVLLEKERCLQSWWTNILYINNYVGTDHLCMFQSWYLAVDYHMFFIAPFIIYPLWKWSNIGKTILAVCTTIAAIIPFWITFKDRLDPTLLSFGPEISDLSTNFYFVNVYIKTHMRATSYFIGILFGYIVYKFQKSGKKISKIVIWVGWSVAAICGFVSMFSVVVFYYPDHLYNAFESAIYASLHRIAWCFAIGWVLVVCITDNAGLVNKFLSWKLFIPLSRLTYCAYLVNGLVEVYNIGVQREPQYMSRYDLLCRTSSHVLITFGLAFLLCVLFESPIHGLEKILLSREKRMQNTQNTTSVPINK